MNNNKRNNIKQQMQDLNRPRAFQFVQSGAIHYTIGMPIMSALTKTIDSSSKKQSGTNTTQLTQSIFKLPIIYICTTLSPIPHRAKK